jgi:hypothetical protein
MILRSFQFLAVMLTALALVPVGAHLFSMPNKITLAADQYLIAQSLYRGWALFGIVLFAAIAANFATAMLVFYQGKPFALAGFAVLCMGISLIVFFVWTYPANVATNNWTELPRNWEALRSNWEYSHAANAVIVFVALCAAMLSVLTTRE